MNKEKQFIGGLRKLPKDERDFKLGQLFKQPKPEFLPLEYELPPQPIMDQDGYDFCFPTGTPILMENLEYKPIQEVLIGDYVYTHLGNIKKVIKKYQRIWQGRFIEIKLFGEFRIIKSTPEHPFLVVKNIRGRGDKKLTNNKYLNIIKSEFIQAKKIKKGDWIAMPKLKNYKDTSLYSFEKDPDFLWVLGLYLAEGSLDEYRVRFHLNINEDNYANKVKKVMEKYGANVYFCKLPKSNNMVVYINDGSSFWVKIFQELGNKLCYAKKINQRLMLIDPKLQMEIVNGFMAGDGHITKNSVSAASTSYELLNQIKIILSRNNIYSSFQKRKERNDRLPTWGLEYYSKNNTRYLEDENNFYVKVAKINFTSQTFCPSGRFYYKGSGNVYNLEIENDNSYLVNGFAVHNCAAFAGVVASQDQEGIRLDPFFQFAMTKKEEGNLSWGADFRSLGKSFTKVGSIKLEDAPYGYDKPRDFLADWKNYSQVLIDKAAEHKKKSYIFVKGAYDFFDDIRTAMDLGKNKKQSVIMGLTWQVEWINAPGGIIDKTGTDQVGHALSVRGWKIKNGITYLKVQNSWNETGDRGYYYLSREIVNRFEPYGALFFEDYTPEELRYYIDNGILINESWLINFYKQIINIYKQMIDYLIKKKEDEKPKPEPAPEPIPESKYKWATPEEARHSIRVICDEERLSVADKNLLCQVINCESGFNINAVNINKNGTKDYSLCQWNSKYWVGDGKLFSSPEDVIANPEKQIRSMIKLFKGGKLSLWVCYKTNLYQKFKA